MNIESHSKFIAGSHARILLSALCLVTAFAYAEPTTPPLKIKSIRTYNALGGSGAAYVNLSQVSVCGTDTYKIDFTFGASKEALSSAMSALLADKPVQVEVVNTGCTGWATTLQSIYIIQQ
jgi:hypothetical protein